MRFVEAVVRDDYRDAYVKIHSKRSREELDARNSEKERVVGFYEDVICSYNDASWIPKSTSFGDFHFELDRSIELRFDGDALTVEQAKGMYRDMRAAMNIALANWKASGRGEGRRDEGVKYRFNGTVYEEKEENGDESDSDDVEFINDNRSDFINGNLSVGYLWCLLEKYHLVSTCSQNCEAVGMTMDAT